MRDTRIGFCATFFAAVAIVPAIHAQANPEVQRLPEATQSAGVNPTGASVHLRAAIDQATVGAADRAPVCDKPIIVSDISAAQRLIAERKTAEAEIAQLKADLDRLGNVRLSPALAVMGAERNRNDIAPFVTDVVRVSDSIRFFASLFTAQYTYESGDVTPTPGLVEARIGGGSARRFSQPVATESPIEKSFKELQAKRNAVQSHLDGLVATANEKQAKDLAPAIAGLAQVTASINRYIVPGASGAPAPLAVLISLDFALPKAFEPSACFVSFQTSADVTSIHTTRFLPSRTFTVLARSVVTATQSSLVKVGEDSQYETANPIGVCTVKVTIDPKVAQPLDLAKPACLEEPGGNNQGGRRRR